MSLLVLRYQGEPPTPPPTDDPELPDEYVVPAFSLPVGGTEHYPTTGAELQAAFDTATEGDVIYLDADTVYDRTISIPAAAPNGNQWVYVMSTRWDQLPPEGTRVTPADTVNMGTMRVPNKSGYHAINKDASRYRFVGIDITSILDDQSAVQYGIVRVSYEGTGPGASDIVFDRCHIHGQPAGNNRDGVQTYDVTGLAFVQCRFDDWHAVGSESHALHIFTQSKKVTIEDCYIEAAGINVFIGDSVGVVPPEDVVIRNNNLYKPHRWKEGHPDFAGIKWLVKNLWECKAGIRVLAEYNAMEQNWADSQDGRAVIIAYPHESQVSDVTFRRNIVREAPGGCLCSIVNNTITRVLIEDNLFCEFYKTPGFTGYAVAMAGAQNYFYGPATVRFNTMMAHPDFASQYSGGLVINSVHPSGENDIDNLIVHDNIFTAGQYQFHTNVLGTATESKVDFYCKEFRFQKNAQVSGLSGVHAPYNDDTWTEFSFPANNAAVGFTDPTLSSVPGSYVLTPTSPYYRTGTDNKDWGANIELLTGIPVIGDG